MKYPLKHKLFSVFLAVVLLLSMTACNSGDTLITCNGLDISESTFLMLMTEQATDLWGEEGITEDNIVEKAKEATLDYLPVYTYYKQGYTDAGYTLSEEDRGTLQASALSVLLDNGLEYEESKEDQIFIDTFGVDFAQYMDYQEESYLISYFYETELAKVEVEEDLLQSYFAEHQAEYAICTADIVRLQKQDGATDVAGQVSEALRAGKSLDDCKQQLGDALDKAETLTFDATSNLDSAFGDGFVQKLVAAKQGEIVTLETESYITVARLNTLSGYEENLSLLKNALREDVYAKQIEDVIAKGDYTPEIVNKEAYDAITEIPGSDLK